MSCRKNTTICKTASNPTCWAGPTENINQQCCDSKGNCVSAYNHGKPAAGEVDVCSLPLCTQIDKLAPYYNGKDAGPPAVPCFAPNNLFQCDDKSSYVCADPSQKGAFWRQHCPGAQTNPSHKHHHHRRKGNRGAMIAFWVILGVIILLLLGIVIYSSVTMKKNGNSSPMGRRGRR